MGRDDVGDTFINLSHSHSFWEKNVHWVSERLSRMRHGTLPLDAIRNVTDGGPSNGREREREREFVYCLAVEIYEVSIIDTSFI